MNRSTIVALATVALVVAGCARDSTSAPRVPASVSNLVVAGSSANVLSAIATVTIADADSARLVFWTGSEAHRAAPVTTTPAAGRMLALGLRQSTAYSFAVEAYGGGTTTTSDTVTFTTAALPAYLALASITSSAPASGGYFLTSIHQANDWFVVAFDSTGVPAWYHEFAGAQRPTYETRQQPNGNFTVLTGGQGGEVATGQAVEMTPDGTVIRTIVATAPSYLDLHELLLDDQGGAVMFQYTRRHLDLSTGGGPADTIVAGHQLVRQDASGAQSIVFDAWDHFTESDDVEPAAGQVDFDHPNSIAIAADGNYVVSWRDFDAITKINASTGAIMWTLAGSHSALTSDFTFVGDPLGGFSAQHSARVLSNGNLLIFDNGTLHTVQASRAVEYHLDEVAHTATLVWSYTHAPAIFVQFTGSVQRLANGNTLIGWTFGSPLLATEVSPAGTVVWEGTLNAAGPQVPYRFTKIASLYDYSAP